jgi:hypothetical protein
MINIIYILYSKSIEYRIYQYKCVVAIAVLKGPDLSNATKETGDKDAEVESPDYVDEDIIE